MCAQNLEEIFFKKISNGKVSSWWAQKSVFQKNMYNCCRGVVVFVVIVFFNLKKFASLLFIAIVIFFGIQCTDDEFGEKTVSVLLDGEESEIVFIDHPSSEMSVSFPFPSRIRFFRCHNNGCWAQSSRVQNSLYERCSSNH